MDGQRDTEIAIGCFQTQKTTDVNNISLGAIHAYRMSLWYEHTGKAEEIFKRPQSLECVDKMKFIGDQMWKIYSGEQVLDMNGVHLLTYPIVITEEGQVEDVGLFPDTNTPVKGKRSKLLPPIFTT